jgi:beta-N-acetylhexosaminidase
MLDAQVESILASMSPSDRVGQLFVVTFVSNDTSYNSDIAHLILDYRIGGVVLSPSNMNFGNGKGIATPHQVATLTNQLQALAYGVLLPADQTFAIPTDGSWPPPGLVSLTSQSNLPPPNIPLFIAAEQLGDGLPFTSLRREFTPLPSQMALGATWNVGLARKVGQIVGMELRAVGINLLLGPNLDLFDQPRADRVGALGLHAFGGNPYWVGQMGRAYIAGVHDGSRGRVATVARNFPGQGSIDRLPDQEIATVQLSLDELRQTAIFPFRRVTTQSSLILQRTGIMSATDGLMTSHMRYNALPGSATPMSLGPELNMTLNQEGFADWHDGGGLLMSNPIGTLAVRRYYDPSLASFSPRRVALDVFAAGHDLIYLDQLSLENDWAEEKAAIQETIGFFQERYTSDSNFAAQVDSVVRRILRLKLRLYGPSYLPPSSMNANGIITPTVAMTASTPVSMPAAITLPVVTAPRILVSADGLNVLTGTVRTDAIGVISQVARDSLTILYPDIQNLPAALPTAPQAEDRLLIFSDSRLLRECDSCTAEAAIGPDEIAEIIIRNYGPTGSGQVLVDHVVSETFADLDQLLRSTAPPPGSRIQTSSNATPTVTVTIATPTTVEIETSEPTTQTAETLDKLAKLESEIEQANWLIFAMLDVDPEGSPTSDVVKRFLSQRAEAVEKKNVIVFALHAPYFLDATEISKLTAYFGVYSKSRPFLESAVRALFRSATPVGAPPVSVPGTPYGSLAERLAPDPQRPFSLKLLVGENELSVQSEDNDAPIAHNGEVLRLLVGPVLDRNGRPAPDGTPVNFDLIFEGEVMELNVEPANTRSGLAMRDVTLDRTGKLSIWATAGAASIGAPVVVNVQPPLPEIAALTPAATPPPTSTTVELTNTTAITTSGQGSATSSLVNGRRISIFTLLIALFTIVVTLSLLLIAQVQILPRQVLMHNMLWAVIFGLGAYILYGLGLLPGVSMLQEKLGELGPAIVVFIAMLLPLLWLQLRTEQVQ